MPIPMRDIARALGKLVDEILEYTTRVSARTARGLAQTHLDRYTKNLVAEIRINNKWIKFVYEELSEDDKEIIDHMRKYARSYVVNYIDDHKEYMDKRSNIHEFNDIMHSHAEEIFNAGLNALNSRIQSYSYDTIFGNADTDDEEALKQWTLSILNECVNAFKDN
jgi:hypothetical protein